MVSVLLSRWTGLEDARLVAGFSCKSPTISASNARFRPLGEYTHLSTPLPSTSKHILNAQVSIRAPCCKQWFDCAECHAEAETHRLAKTSEMVFMCKKCRKAFRKNMAEYDESDEYCPHCDNHYVSPALALMVLQCKPLVLPVRLLKPRHHKW